MLRVHLGRYAARFGESFALSFERTLRVSDDGRSYPLPPDLGPVELFPFEAYRARVPTE
jgi:hypothetical protein